MFVGYIYKTNRVKIQFLRNKILLSLHNSTIIENQFWTIYNSRLKDESLEGQAKKSARGMPWHQEPMKDVISCDKLRGAANEH